MWQRGERPTCPRCGRTAGLGTFRKRDGGTCPRCAQAPAAAPPPPTFPTMDLVVGVEAGGGRERLVRLQRVGALLRLAACVRLDQRAVRVLGTFTVPLRHVDQLQQALARIATGASASAAAPPDPG